MTNPNPGAASSGAAAESGASARRQWASSGWTGVWSLLNVGQADQGGKRLVAQEAVTGETAEQRLLRRRLRAVASVLFLARLAYTVQAAVRDELPFNLLAAGVLAGLLLTFLLLKQPRGWSVGQLRGLEYALFLGMTLDFSVSLNQRLAVVNREMAALGVVDTAYVAEFIMAVKDHLIGIFALMMIYGMFVPNTPRRAAAVVLWIALLPGAVILSNQQSRAGLTAVSRENLAAVEKLQSTNLLSLLIGAGCAIYGSAFVNRLRQRAQSAEELGQYVLREKVGSGGMGDVYMAEHKLLRRICAVKLIRSDQAEDPVMLQRFEREVRATASLTHWNTIQIFDYGRTEDGRFFYVMEFLNGRNLHEIVQRFGPLPPDRTVFILEQVCEALRESSARGLVHRDIKPSNIFLASLGGRFDVVKLLDFGLVRPVATADDADVQEHHQINGSPRFMCPEQAQGQIPDIRGDLYSLGAVAYFLLSGRPPFESENPLQLVLAHATQQPPTFDELHVDVPAALAAVIMRCLRKRPEERFASPDELLTAFRQLPQHGHWTWALAEHWWHTSLPECLEEPLPGTAVSITLESSGTAGSSCSATDPTLIDISQQTAAAVHR